MSRRLRFIPDDGALVEVTTRTLHSRYLLRSSPELDEIIVGVLGRAQRLYEVRICGYLFLSSHYHLLLDVDNARQLALFMAYVNSNLAREISRLYRWPEKIWSRRYQGIVISGEEPAQIARMRYLLANGSKEGLVASPQDWPGVHVAKALIQGEDLTGHWFDRTQEYAARNRGETFDRLQFATPETLYLSPLPCWKHLPEDAWRGRAGHLIQEIEDEAAVAAGGGAEGMEERRGDLFCFSGRWWQLLELVVDIRAQETDRHGTMPTLFKNHLAPFWQKLSSPTANRLGAKRAAHAGHRRSSKRYRPKATIV